MKIKLSKEQIKIMEELRININFEDILETYNNIMEYFINKYSFDISTTLEDIDYSNLTSDEKTIYDFIVNLEIM